MEHFRSPLKYVDEMEAPTLIFLGSEDKRVLPESQGIALYKALRSRMIPSTVVYHYTGTMIGILILVKTLTLAFS